MYFNMIAFANQIADHELGILEECVLDKYPVFKELYYLLEPHGDLISEVNRIDDDCLSIEVVFKRGVDSDCIASMIMSDECLSDDIIDVWSADGRLYMKADRPSDI